MTISKCRICQSKYTGPVCPRCALENLRNLPPERAPDGPAVPAGVTGDLAAYDTVAERAETLGEEDLLGHFRIVRCIGEGGMSRVYEAIDTKLNRRVAIKIPKAEVLRDPNGCEWFTQEGQSIARMKDRHVVRVHHSQEFDGIPCHVMEFIEGETLAKKIEREKRLSPDEATRIGRDIALGLLEVHVHGRIHGDIKPANIIVGRRHATIVDFGLSRQLSSSAHDARVFAGTPEYMPPERVRGESSGVSEDVYSLGCTVLEMLAGGPLGADDSTTPMETRGGVTHPPSAGELANVPKPLVEVVNSLIAEDPIDRPASAKEVAHLFDNWLSRKRRNRRNAGLLGLAAMFVSACLLLYLHAYPHGDIAILSVDGTVRDLCGSLAEASSKTRQGEILELRSNGPFCCDSAIITDRPLIIRAGHGFAPLIELTCPAVGKAALTCYESLAIEGLTIRCQFAPMSNAGAMIYCTGDSLRIKNCRLELAASPSALTCITAVGTSAIDVENSVFVSHRGTAISWEPSESAKLMVSNCLMVGGVGVEYRPSGEPRQISRLRLERCTVVGNHVVSMVPADGNRFESEPDLPTRVETRSNVFRTSMSLVQFKGWPSDRDAAATMAAHLDWRDHGNIHVSARDRSVCWNPIDAPVESFRADCLSAWTPHWGLVIEDVDAIVVLGGNVREFVGPKPRARAAHDLLQRIAAAGKTLCGIGDGPAVLADGGFLEGRRATVQPRFVGKLEDGGAIITNTSPVMDGRIITAESNVDMKVIVNHFPDRPVVLAIIAEKGFWFDDYRAAKFDVEGIGGTLLTVSTTAGTAKPDKAGGGEPIYPDLLLPKLRNDGGLDLELEPDGWSSANMAVTDPAKVQPERFQITAEALGQAADIVTPGIDAALIGPDAIPTE